MAPLICMHCQILDAMSDMTKVDLRLSSLPLANLATDVANHACIRFLGQVEYVLQVCSTALYVLAHLHASDFYLTLYLWMCD